MCGIAGFVRKNNLHINDTSTVLSMMHSIKHRGPDDEGLEEILVDGINSKITLGFVRLSIRDLSIKGHQPMYNADKQICIAFNGEIYNADSLRVELENEGYFFNSTSDTEVILKLYEAVGIEKMLQRINGMFAIVIVDSIKNKIFFVRDRVGEKPLYYYRCEDGIYFASEYKAFYKTKDFIPKLNIDAVDEFLLFNGVSGEDNLLLGVKTVLPGYYYIVDDNITKKQYYTIPADASDKTILSVEDLEQQLKESVKSRMVSDVEVGVELSGGIDSSLVTLYANGIKNGIKAYSVVFEDQNLSEEKYANLVCEKTACDNKKICLSNEDFISSFFASTYSYEAPLHHQGSIQLFNLCKEIKKDLKVVLTGESADELFGGYTWYPMSMYYEHPFYTGEVTEEILESNKGWQSIGLDTESTFLTFDSGIFYGTYMKMVKNANYKNVLKKRMRIYNETPGEGFQKRLNYEMRTFMIELLLRQDKISMAHSIECRVPFMDQNLIQYVRERISESDLVKKSEEYDPVENSKKTKLALKKVAATHFGDSFAYRKKEGLHSPLVDYFYSPDFKKYIENVILPNVKRREIFNYDYIKKCYTERTHIQDVLWRCFSFEVWADMYIDGNFSRCYNGNPASPAT